MGAEHEFNGGQSHLTLAQAARYVAERVMDTKDWSGLPIPVPGLQLVLEPRYNHQGLEDFQWNDYYDENGEKHSVEHDSPRAASDYRLVNSWWSSQLQVTIRVLRNKDGKARADVLLENRLSFALRTAEASMVWPIEAEQRAQNKLSGLISKEAFDQYFLTGLFSEVSRRSGLTYIFRKGRPTIAIRYSEDWMKPLCALCLHPIGYYADTWAGAMCPTDEVIAHLLMMRGSEEKYWANANQHPIEHHAAGV